MGDDALMFLKTRVSKDRSVGEGCSSNSSLNQFKEAWRAHVKQTGISREDPNYKRQRAVFWCYRSLAGKKEEDIESGRYSVARVTDRQRRRVQFAMRQAVRMGLVPQYVEKEQDWEELRKERNQRQATRLSLIHI